MHTLCIRASKALASLRFCADPPDHSLLDNAISIKNSWTDSYMSLMTLLQYKHLSI